MTKCYSRLLVLLVLNIILFTVYSATAQTVTITNVDPGPYTPGSTIGVPLHIDFTNGCITQKNVFNLYLSDASGSFTSEILIGSYTGFYNSYVNGVLPAGIAPGTGYRVRVKTTQPVTVSAASSVFSIVAGASVTAKLNGQSIGSTNAEIFGICNGQDGTNFIFTNGSSAGATASASFFNELSQSTELKATVGSSGISFPAKAANYTIFVRAENAGTVGTKAYPLLNNTVSNAIESNGNNSVCLSENKGTIVFTIPPTSIANNYPGNTYNLSFGDGTVLSLTQCDIVNSGGKFAHTYTSSSCGLAGQQSANSFDVRLQSINPYCGAVGTSVSTSAKVFEAPYNKITGIATACTNSAVTFINSSYPGQNPNATGGDCLNASAQYTWSVDGTPVLFNAKVTDKFNYQFTTPGPHKVTLDLQGGSTVCNTATVSFDICIQNPPQPAFTLPTGSVCLSSPVTPVDQSVVDNNCSVGNNYLWTITGPAAVTYAGGTSNTSTKPQFVFATPGTYKITLAIASAGCGTVVSSPQTLIVDGTPVTKLSADVALCGNNQTLSFGTGTGPTQTTLTGTTQATTDTYTWTVSGGNYTYTNNTNSNSQYPQIIFNDYSTYTITVVQKNSCGSTTSTQHITFQEAPTVSAGTEQHICSTDLATLNGSITGNVNSYQWTGGTGTFSPGRNVLNPTYTPSAAEIKAGQVTLNLQAQTSLAAPCNTIISPVTIFIAAPVTITSPATLNVCTGQTFNYNITGSNSASTFTWTAALTSGSATGFTASGSGSTINDMINVSGSANAIVTYTIVPSAASCPGQPFTLTVTVAPLPVITATATAPLICSSQPADIKLSSNITNTAYTWTSTISGSIKGNSNQLTPIAATNIADVLTNEGTAQASVTYVITPYNGTCAGTPITVKVTVQPLPVTANAGGDNEVCNVTNYTLNGNDPGAGTGKWTVASGQAGITFADDTKPNTTVSGLIPGSTYQFTWTITAAPTCPSSSNTITIINDKASFGGTTTGTNTVCAGTNNGSITLNGQVGNILRWESSSDKGVTWLTVANTTVSLSYLNLTTTMQYRAVVQSGKCSIAYSTVSTITVNAATISANAGADQSLCNASTATLTANNPAPLAGVWIQTGGTPVTIATPNNYQTQITGLTAGNVYKFTWTIKGLAPCNDIPDEVQITNATDVTPSFTASTLTGCGTAKVSFTNTSTTLTGTAFLWDFGDGTTSNLATPPMHTYAPSADGKDKTYTVSLSVVNNCVVHTPFTQTITVSPAIPTATILPDNLSGCAPFILNVQNVSPGTNKSYDFYLYDGSTLIQKITKTDKSAVTFTPLLSKVKKTYTLYMVATNSCGATGESTHFPINVSPPDLTPLFIAKNNLTVGCAPFTATFTNTSVGGTAYYYKIYDSANKLLNTLVAGTADFQYQFTTPGDYSVTITATDDCTPVGLESAKTYFHVYAVPQPAFKGNVLTGCSSLTVTFTNLTPADASGTPSASLAYSWNFGDGTQSTTYSPTHKYTSPGKYSVTLTTTNNATQCNNSVTLTNYVVITAPPLTDFRVQPDTVISIPNYHFNFTDETTGANVTTWRWSFGDGSTSTSQNPSHTYSDTGHYTVTLTTADGTNCPSTKIRHVAITGVPGQLYVPNAFMPTSTTDELRTFIAKGSGLKAYHLQIFNNWGQLVWETTKLSSKGEPVEGWDGNFKGAPVPQGVYIWEMSATFINGNEWKGMSYNNSTPKRTGAIHLIR